MSVAVVGNSFAYFAFSAVVEAFKKDVKEIRLLSHPGCEPFFNTSETGDDVYTLGCARYFEKTVAVITDMKPDIIFLIFM